jgi:RND family efflux transporter MFP subunit
MQSKMGLQERSTQLRSLALGATGALVLVFVLASCQKEEKAAATPIRPVRTVIVELQEGGERVSLTGEIQPRYQADIGFRVNGKILQRPVDVGTPVKHGDLLARLDPQQYRQDLEVAKSEVAAAEAEITRSQAQEYRQRELLKNGHTTQVAYDQALKTLRTAQAQLDAARAKQIQARENLGYTELKADYDGVITAVGADAGQVVGAGQMVVRLARPGEREAVFNVAEGTFKSAPKDPTVEVDLVSNPEVKTVGKVRYVSPQADPETRTYTVRVSLPDAPPQMRLGANVIGSVTLAQGKSVAIPGSALFQKDDRPAVWLVDKDGTVELKPITVQRYQGDSVVVSDGLAQGDVIVTAGVQNCFPARKSASCRRVPSDERFQSLRVGNQTSPLRLVLNLVLNDVVRRRRRSFVSAAGAGGRSVLFDKDDDRTDLLAGCDDRRHDAAGHRSR